MKTWKYLLLVPALVLPACDDEKPASPDSSVAPPMGEPDGEGPKGEPDGETPPEGQPDGMVNMPDMPDAEVPPDDASTDGGAPQAAWYECQSSDQAFVRSAIQAVLGRRPHSQDEVQVYTDLISQIDALDGLTDAQKFQPPGAKMRRSRKLMLQALYKDPQYATHWEQVYRDIIRVQRVDETHIPACFVSSANPDPIKVANYVRSTPASVPATDLGVFNMADVIKGSVALDDISPVYTANIFAMLTETYAGANATPIALELGRRRDFGAWFDAVYLNRDVVCLGCHNSEFSVTQTDDPATNRHYPLTGLVEKTLFGASTGPATFGGYEGLDRKNAVLRYKDFVNDCTSTTAATAADGCATGELVWRCMNGGRICDSVYQKRLARPWGWVQQCGRYTEPQHVVVDIAGVDAKFGNLTGFRASPWGLDESLRTGFIKLRKDGLGVDAMGEVADPDKAFAYLVTVNIVEKVWLQVVGTPLTIPTRYPRNAAARDQLASLVDTFVKSGYSNQRLVEAILASPYTNLPSPDSGCGQAYGLPNIFDPWVIADNDPVKKKNSIGDSVISLPPRTASGILYSALGWTLNPALQFPDTSRNRNNAMYTAERNFQTEVGFFLKNAEPGFRGFDFQARLGWEDRFATCNKFSSLVWDEVNNPQHLDFIDKLLASAKAKPGTTVGDVVAALKDRLVGRPYVDSAKEAPALEAMLGAGLSDEATAIEDTDLRKVCGVIVSSPQFLMTGLPAKDQTSAPKLTPPEFSYAKLCLDVEKTVTSVDVICDADELIVAPR